MHSRLAHVQVGLRLRRARTGTRRATSRAVRRIRPPSSKSGGWIDRRRPARGAWELATRRSEGKLPAQEGTGASPPPPRPVPRPRRSSRSFRSRSRRSSSAASRGESRSFPRAGSRGRSPARPIRCRGFRAFSKASSVPAQVLHGSTDLGGPRYTPFTTASVGQDPGRPSAPSRGG